MSTYQNNAEGAPLSTELVIANTGGTSGDAFTAITRSGAGGTASFQAVDDAILGARAYRVRVTAATDTLSLDWTQSTGVQTGSWAMTGRAVAIAGAECDWFDVRASSIMGRLSVLVDGSVKISNALDAGVWTSAAGIIPFDGTTVWHVDFTVHGGTGTTDGKARVRVQYLVGGSWVTQLDQEVTGVNMFRSGGVTRRRTGKFSPSGTVEYLFKYAKVTDAYELIGPQVATVPAGPFAGVLGVMASNMRGNAQDYAATTTDAYPAGVWQWNPDTGQILAAIEPLHTPDTNTGMGPINTYVKDLITGGETRPILIMNTARGGTGFSTTDSSGTGNLCWRTDLPVTSNNLFENALAIVAAASAATTNGVDIVAILCNQGTTDSTQNMTPSTWTGHMRAFVQGLRSRLSLPTVPFLMMQSRPSLMGENRHLIIDQAAQAIPTVEPYTAYAYSPVGATYENPDPDSTHFNALGVRTIGHNLYAVLPDAQANVQTASGGSNAPVTVATTGGGVRQASGGSNAAVTVTTTGAGVKRTTGGSNAAVSSTATGGGTKRSSAGSTSTVTTSTSGAGAKTVSGGASTSVAATVSGAGVKRGQGGSLTTITISATGGGIKPTSGQGGSNAAVAVGATGSGVAYRSGGATTTVHVLPLGAGSTARSGGSMAGVLVSATGGGSNPDNARDITVTVTLGARRWSATLAPRNKTAVLAARRWEGTLP